MSEPSTLVQQIHDAGHPLVLGVTGGGSLALSRLLTVPGASRSVLEATVPYSSAALCAWLQSTPEQFCVATTARQMAMAALARAIEYARGARSQEPGVALERLIGVGCTASLASDRPKRGAHRVYVAWQSTAATVTFALELEKGARTRAEEEILAADLVLNAIADAAGIAARTSLALRPGENIIEQRSVAPPEWRELLFAAGPPVGVGPVQRQAPALFPGAFHPLHAGHRGMAEVASRKLGMPVHFELSVKNVDKPPLDFTEIEGRLAQFLPSDGVWLTAAPTFVEKARRFPGATFVVGLDTITRIGEARYYCNSEPARDAALQELTTLGCRFLVFGRRTGDRFDTLQAADIPPALRALCTEVPEQEFRLDISSTELRRAKE